MAGGFISSMIKGTYRKLSSLIPSSTDLPSSSSSSESHAAFEDLKKLERTMKRIQAIVMDAERRGVKGQAEKLRLEELQEVAYDADDVVDEYEYEVLSAKIKAGTYRGGDDYKHKREHEENQKISSQLTVPVPSELAIRVREIRKRFDEIICEWEALGWSESQSLGWYDIDMVDIPPESTSLVHEPNVYGRDEDKHNIIKTLISDNNNSDVTSSFSVLPIVGIGGIGKTTLAQLVYNDARVCEYFQLRAWICVSDEFIVKRIIRNILVSFNNETCNFTELDVIQRNLIEKVKGKKFLIVLDDVWNEQPSLWHSLKAPLVGAGFGKIIVTTRLENVALYMQTMPYYVLTNLPFEHCWSLFKQFAFECKDPNSNPGLLQIGKEIVRKCGGLPLAVKALGSLLRVENNENNWQEILDSDYWFEIEKDVLPALKISYDRLPVNLKQCFLVLSLFPNDCIIFEDNIICLWLSLGFIHPEGKKSVEDIGVGYVSELTQRSMIQLTQQKNYFGDIDHETRRCFIMHDLINDMAKSISRVNIARITSDISPELTDKTRYISVVPSSQINTVDLQHFSTLRKPRLLQVLNTNNSYYSNLINEKTKVMIPPELFLMLKHLRAVDFSHSDIETLHDSIGNLKQLRYLNLRFTKIRKLPDSICDLYYLQTLDLRESLIKELPIGITNLVNLRHLLLDLGVCIPAGIGKLLNLRTLPCFSIKPGTWHCTLSELKILVNLQGQLCINGLKYVASVNDVVEANLCNKKYLRQLKLDWDLDRKFERLKFPLFRKYQDSCYHSKANWQSIYGIVPCEEVFCVPKPHVNIEKLHISNYDGLNYPSWLGDASFSRLVKITISCCYMTSKLPTLGQLPSLRDLTINSIFSIENVGREFCSHDPNIAGFRSLETLELIHMPNWKNWSGVENGDFLSLQSLTVLRCPELQFIPEPLCFSLSTLYVDNCKTLKFYRLPALTMLRLCWDISEVFFDGLYLPVLKTLELSCASITSIIITSDSFPLIETIKIMSCDELTNVVGLSSLDSLKKLVLIGCSKLEIASDELLPPGLQELTVLDCPYLHEWASLREKETEES